MLNVGRIKIKNGSAGKNANFPVTRDENGWVYGIGEYIREVTLSSGTYALDLSGIFSAIDSVQCTLKGADAAEANKCPAITYGVSTTTVTVYGWKHTSTSNPTLIANTDAVVISVCVRGTLLAAV